jgi:hypothetical protein
MTTHQTITDLVAVTARLIELMGREIESLRAMQPREIEAMQADKAALSRAYAALVRDLKAAPDGLAAVEPVVRDELQRLAARFDDAVAENARALRSASEANMRLIKAIADAAERQLPQAAGYTASGTSAARPVGPRGRVAALALNQRT